MTWQPLGEKAGETVFSIAVPSFIGVQHKHQTVRNFCHVQDRMQVGWNDNSNSETARESLHLPVIFSVTCVRPAKGKSLFKARENKTKAVHGPADSLIFVHYTIEPFSFQFLCHSTCIHSCMQTNNCNQVRRSIPAAQLAFLCQHLWIAKTLELVTWQTTCKQCRWPQHAALQILFCCGAADWLCACGHVFPALFSSSCLKPRQQLCLVIEMRIYHYSTIDRHGMHTINDL